MGWCQLPASSRFLLKSSPAWSSAARLYPASAEAPAILYFHGNGEIAADYDFVAPAYTALGLTLLVIDYRGYGASDGTPTATNLLLDAVAVFEAASDVFEDNLLSPAQLYLMGRSLGSAAAIEVALQAGERMAGLIIESGFADTLALLTRLGVRVPEVDEGQAGFSNYGQDGTYHNPPRWSSTVRMMC